MRPVRWNEQALTPVGWKWEALRMGSCRGVFWFCPGCEFPVPCLYTTLYCTSGSFERCQKETILLWKIIFQCFWFVSRCAAEVVVFLRLIWPLPVNTIQYKVSCFQWLASSHPTSLLFKLVHSAVVKETSLCCWTTSNFPVILTLRDCPIHTSCILLTNSGLE